MFTLSAILLEDRENLFQDFWTLFSISFICFSMLGFILKKIRTDLTGRVHPGHYARRPLKPARDGRPSPPSVVAVPPSPDPPPAAPDLAEPPPLTVDQSVFFG